MNGVDAVLRRIDGVGRDDHQFLPQFVVSRGDEPVAALLDQEAALTGEQFPEQLFLPAGAMAHDAVQFSADQQPPVDHWAPRLDAPLAGRLDRPVDRLGDRGPIRAT